jgi:23S rRNA pseudouridine1911/1915/1917 synthase
MGIRTFTTDRGDSGHRLDHVLRRHLASLEAATRTRVQRWIEDGAVSVNGRCVARTATRIAAGDTISVWIPPAAEAGRPPMLASCDQLEILFEDEYLLAVNKPAGIVVHPTHAHATGTLMNALLWHARSWSPPSRPSIAGRLDKLTSGIVLVAKSAAMHAALQRAMAAADCDKDYLAIVYGRVAPTAGRIALRLSRDPVDRRKVIASEHVGAPSLTHFERVARVAARPVGLTLLRCRLFTGRTHQIRVHLSARGWPLVGDPTYGEPHWSRISDRGLADALRRFPRQALHASRLAFRHPRSSALVEVLAPIPGDMRDLLERTGFCVSES